jgi:hypothetical protein
MRQRYCKYCSGWHDIEAWPDNCCPPREFTRSDYPAPMVIADTMAPVQSQLDGKYYDSKAALRSTYKQAGVIEVGNDPQRFKPRAREKAKPDRQAIKNAVERAKARYNRGERAR